MRASILLFVLAVSGCTNAAAHDTGARSDSLRVLAHDVEILKQVVDSLAMTSIADPLAHYRILREAYDFRPYVSFTDQKMQEVGAGFLVADLKQDFSPGGFTLTGTVVNAQAIAHKMAEFRLVAGTASETFVVNW